MGDGRAALPRLVRIQAAVDAAVEGVGEGGAEKAAGRRRAGEGVGENRQEGGNDVAEIGNDHRDRADQVNHRHRRHHGGGELGDAGDAADDHQRKQRRHENGGDQRVEIESAFKSSGDVVDLRQVAGAEGAEHRGDGEQHRQPFQLEALFHVVHRPAGDGAVLGDAAVLVRQGDLNELARHAEESRHPHPEQRRRPAKMEGEGHAADIARADGAGKRRGQGLEVAGFAPGAVLVEFALGDGDGVAEIADLGKSKIYGEENAGGQQQGGKPDGAAEKAIDENEKVVDSIHGAAPGCRADLPVRSARLKQLRG